MISREAVETQESVSNITVKVPVSEVIEQVDKYSVRQHSHCEKENLIYLKHKNVKQDTEIRKLFFSDTEGDKLVPGNEKVLVRARGAIIKENKITNRTKLKGVTANEKGENGKNARFEHKHDEGATSTSQK